MNSYTGCCVFALRGNADMNRFFGLTLTGVLVSDTYESLILDGIALYRERFHQEPEYVTLPLEAQDISIPAAVKVQRSEYLNGLMVTIGRIPA